jgi:hypothetical protein
MARQDSTQRDLVAAAQEWWKRNRPILALLLFLTAIGLNTIGTFVGSSRLMLATGIAFLVVVMERLSRIGGDVGTVLELQKTDRQPVFTFAECMTDIHDRLKHTRRTDKIAIQHLGLDMTEAWKELARALASCDAVSVDCSVLIMTDNPDALGPDAASEIKGWCKAVPGSIARIMQDTPRLAEVLRQRNTNLRLTLKKYTGTPRIHGVVVTAPFERGYVSFASWAQNAHFEWGGDDYFRFESGTTSDADRRLRQLLRGAFEYHWDRNSELVLQYPEQPTATPVTAGTR